jgi:hypothetical protein
MVGFLGLEIKGLSRGEAFDDVTQWEIHPLKRREPLRRHG